MFEIRNAEFEDLDEICRVYEAGRAYMRSHGNDVQWVGDDFPFRAKLENDIRLRQLYVVTNAGDICGVFAYIIGVDKTYLEIENGAWLSDDPYGTIHRIASDGRFKGVAKASFEWCYYNHDLDLRVDTHELNITMQNCLKNFGFSYCGVIYIEDGTPRLAYQKKRPAADR